jgi:hypothetical protein
VGNSLICFIEARKQYQQGQNLALQDYAFNVDGKEVVVEVQTGAIQTLNGQLTQEEVQLAARTLIEITANRTTPLLLDETNMVVVAERLCWRGRFRRDPLA